MSQYNLGDVCTADFPFQEEISMVKRRPVIVVTDIDSNGFLNCIMITSKGPKGVKGEVELIDYKSANLRMKSFARVDRIEKLNQKQVFEKTGKISNRDLSKIIETLKKL